MEMNTWIFALSPEAYHGMKQDVAYNPYFEKVREFLDIPTGISQVDDYAVWLGYVELSLKFGLRSTVFDLHGFPYKEWFCEDLSSVEAFRKIYASVVAAAEEHGHFENLEETFGDAL